MANRTSHDGPAVAEGIRPVTCGACGLLFERPAWVLLVLVERIEPPKLRRMLLHWPDELCIEVRRCCRCAQQIAAKCRVAAARTGGPDA
jgi:hypothetical protein